MSFTKAFLNILLWSFAFHGSFSYGSDLTDSQEDLCANYLIKVSKAVDVDFKDEEHLNKSIDAALAEAGVNVSEEDRSTILLAYGLQDFFDLRIAEKAITAELTARGLIKEDQLEVYLRTFSALSSEEQLSVVSNIYRRIIRSMPAHYDSTDVSRLMNVSRSMGLKLKVFSEMYVKWQKVARRRPQEIRLVILMKLLRAKDDEEFVKGVVNQQSITSRFIRWFKKDSFFESLKEVTKLDLNRKVPENLFDTEVSDENLISYIEDEESIERQEAAIGKYFGSLGLGTILKLRQNGKIALKMAFWSKDLLKSVDDRAVKLNSGVQLYSEFHAKNLEKEKLSQEIQDIHGNNFDLEKEQLEDNVLEQVTTAINNVRNSEKRSELIVQTFKNYYKKITARQFTFLATGIIDGLKNVHFDTYDGHYTYQGRKQSKYCAIIIYTVALESLKYNLSSPFIKSIQESMIKISNRLVCNNQDYIGAAISKMGARAKRYTESELEELSLVYAEKIAELDVTIKPLAEKLDKIVSQFKSESLEEAHPPHQEVTEEEVVEVAAGSSSEQTLLRNQAEQ